MKNITRLLAASCTLGLLHAQGNLTPPAGAPVAGMKTLDQIEPRTPISAVTTIGAKGSYYLTANITVSSGSAITINAAYVTLDLNGFTIESTSASPSGTAITINASDVTVANGHISGSGFVNGVNSPSSSNQNLMARNLSVKGCQEKGISFPTTGGTLVESCTVRTITSTNSASSRGIQAQIIRSSTAIDCSFAGIVGNVVSDCTALVNNTAPASSAAIFGSTVTGSSGETQSASGASIGIYGDTISGSKGVAVAGDGISSGGSVSNSHGTSTSGEGIFGFSISNCYGTSTSGTPLSAGIGTISFSHAVRGSAGAGIVATNAIGCTVQGTGVTVSATNKSLGTP